MLQKSFCAAGIRFKNPCEFWSGLGRGSGGALWRNEGPMMQGRRLRRPPHGKARAMACGGKPRALPEFKRADAAAADPGSSVGIAAADLVRHEGNCWDFVHQQLSNQLWEVKSLWRSR